MNKAEQLLDLCEAQITNIYKGHKISAGQSKTTGGYVPNVDGKNYDYECDHSEEALNVAKKIIDGQIKVGVQK